MMIWAAHYQSSTSAQENYCCLKHWIINKQQLGEKRSLNIFFIFQWTNFSLKLQLILTFILDYFFENVSILFIVVYSVYFTISISWCLHLKGWTLRTDSQCWQCIVIMLEKYFFLFWFWFGWYKRCLDIAKVCLYQLIAKIWHKPTNHWFTFSNLLTWCDNLIWFPSFLSYSKLLEKLWFSLSVAEFIRKFFENWLRNVTWTEILDQCTHSWFLLAK